MDRLAKNESSAPVDSAKGGGCAEDGPRRPPSPQSSSLSSIVTIWVIFAPTAVCAAYALFTWASINRTRFNAIYAITLALFFAALFGFLVFGTTRRYLRGRAGSRRR